MTGSAPTAGNAAIRIEHARKVYPAAIGHGAHTAVEGVSIEVPRGAIYGLLGPNGAGKTTTLKMLIGLVRPTAGTFEILGAPSRAPSTRARLGFLPEQPYFPSQLTARQVMLLFAKLSGIASKDIRPLSDGLLDRVGLQGRGDTVLAEFSRGMLQRLGIAQALLSTPEVVVLDEPASGLDPVGQRDVRNLMLELRDEGTTVLLSSHQLSEVEAVCDRVSILNRGGVAVEGTLDELLNTRGQTSVRASGLTEGLPEAVRPLAQDIAVSAGILVFSVPDARVRFVVDAVDDAGGVVESMMPKRESLEDYFTRLLERAPDEEATGRG